MKFPIMLVALISLNVGFAMAGASIEPRFRRDVVDSHKEDMEKLAKLDKNLNFMTHLGSLKKNGGQRRSDEITTIKPLEATTVPAQPVAPQARMSDDTRSTASTTTSTTASTAASTTASTAASTTASTTTAATVAASTIKLTSEPSKDGVRECLHPKDVNCQKAGKTVNLSVGLVHR